MTRVSMLACAIAAVILAGCGAREPVARPLPKGFLGQKLAQLPRGYGIKCDAAMKARHSGSGGAATLINFDGVQQMTSALEFSDSDAARRAYTASISSQTQQCYVDGFGAELVRRYGVKVRRVRTAPWKLDPTVGDERSGTRVSLVITVGRRDVTVTVESAVVRTGSTLSINQFIDTTGLGRREGTPDLRLAQALS
jgi:hypothetical protein